METVNNRSAGEDLVAISSATETAGSTAPAPRVAVPFAVRDGTVGVPDLIDAYMSVYDGRDCSVSGFAGGKQSSPP